LRQRPNVDKSSVQLLSFFSASVELRQVMARASGPHDLSGFDENDLTTRYRKMALLSGVPYSRVSSPDA
jgi:hypothetical protein